MATKPLVSICCVTYNHVDFIKDALDSFLMQKTDFPYEICLGEDESNDGTREICQEYAEKHPDKIRLFLRSRNDVIYMNGQATGRYNFIETLKECKGKYIALCEGDDYWTDPDKLQKQVDLLESNSEYSLCFHNVNTVWEDNRKKPLLVVNSNEKSIIFNTNNIIKNNPRIATSSMVFRKKYIVELPEWFHHTRAGEKTLQLLLSLKGSIGYINSAMSVYRIHKEGVSFDFNPKDSFRIYSQLFGYFNKHTNFQYKHVIFIRLLILRFNILKWRIKRLFII